jgi:hypothetical protein
MFCVDESIDNDLEDFEKEIVAYYDSDNARFFCPSCAAMIAEEDGEGEELDECEWLEPRTVDEIEEGEYCASCAEPLIDSFPDDNDEDPEAEISYQPDDPPEYD